MEVFSTASGWFYISIIAGLVYLALRRRKTRNKNRESETAKRGEVAGSEQSSSTSHTQPVAAPGGKQASTSQGVQKPHPSKWVGLTVFLVVVAAIAFGGLYARKEGWFREFVPVVGVSDGSRPAGPNPTLMQLSESEILAKCVRTVEEANTYPASPDSYTEIEAPGNGLRICHDVRGAENFSILCKPYNGSPRDCSDVAPASYFYRSDKPIGVWFISPYRSE